MVVEEIYHSQKWLDFIVQDVKAPFTTALGRGELPNLRQTIELLKRLPETTRENMHHPNTFILIEMRDEFFSIPEHEAFYGWARPLANGLIFLYDYDNYYRYRIDFVVERWKTKPWEFSLAFPQRQRIKLAWLMATLKGREEPTPENCLPNVRTLVELRDEFNQYEDNTGRTKVFNFIWKAGLVLYNESAYCRYPLDWALAKLNTKPWLPRERQRPIHFWKEFTKKKVLVN